MKKTGKEFGCKFSGVKGDRFNFYETTQKILVTFGGWDGKSYNGEGRLMNVWRNDMHPDIEFFLAGRGKYRSFHTLDRRHHEISGLPTVQYHTDVNDLKAL